MSATKQESNKKLGAGQLQNSLYSVETNSRGSSLVSESEVEAVHIRCCVLFFSMAVGLIVRAVAA